MQDIVLNDESLKGTWRWVKGDSNGVTVVYKEMKEEDSPIGFKSWIYFKNGTRIATDKLGEYLIKISEDEFQVDVPKPAAPIQATQVVSPIIAQPKPKEIQKNPVQLLLEKKAVDETMLPIQLTVNLPNKKFYSILEDTYGGEYDIISEISQSIVDSMSNEQLKEFIKQSIKKKYGTKK